MASIIEKKPPLPVNAIRLPSVFINRLRIGMRLQTRPDRDLRDGERYNGKLLVQTGNADSV